MQEDLNTEKCQVAIEISELSNYSKLFLEMKDHKQVVLNIPIRSKSVLNKLIGNYGRDHSIYIICSLHPVTVNKQAIAFCAKLLNGL